MNRSACLLSWSLIGLGVGLACGAPSAEPQPLFDSEEPLIMRIEAPFRALERQKEEPEWLDGSLTLSSAGAADRTFEIKVKSRGNFRRLSGECDFPTFWINLKKSELPGTVFENQDRLKVVSHCRENQKFYNRYLHREYLTYKTYNLLTESSFRVRLARIEYVYTDQGRRKSVRPAFLIEDADLLAKRLGGSITNNQIVLPEFLNPTALNLADVFQYMIGNTDFDFMASVDECCHNAKVVAFTARDGTFIPVPYDFDLSGIVNAPYAEPNAAMGIDRVTERFYRGIEAPREMIDQTLAAYRLRKDEIMALWLNTPLLSDKDRKEPVAFLEEFFRKIDDPKVIEKEIVALGRSRKGMENLLMTKYKAAYDEWQKK